MGTLLNRRRYMGGGSADEIIMTSTSNPEVLAVCYAQGWAKHADYMTLKEAQKVTSIGTAFRNNTSITHFEELQYFNISSLNDYAFYTCTNLETVTLPATVSTIGFRSFASSQKLAEINLDDVQSIGGLAFYKCQSLTSVNISRCQSLDAGAFFSCTNLVEIGSVESVVKMYTTGNGAFQSTKLQGNLIFSNLNVSIIPSNIINDSYGITNVEFPVCLYVSIGDSALRAGISSFVIREGCTTANNHSLSTSYLKYIDIPSTFTTWNGYALWGNRSQKVIVCRASIPPAIGNSGSFSDIPASCKVYVPSASITSYETTAVWDKFAGRFLPIEGSWYETHRELEPTT